MPIKRPPLVNQGIYHIVTRGVDGRKIFIDEVDYRHAIRCLFVFNDTAPTYWRYRPTYQPYEEPYEDSPRRVGRSRRRTLLVDVLAFCLMPNHIHLLLRQRKDDGITKFMRKFGTGYVGYVNEKYKRQGHLFQGRFKAIAIKTDEQLKTVFVYIHTNPVALIDGQWKEGNIKNSKRAIDFVESYQWSSYLDYLGKENFPFITHREFLSGIMIQAQWREYVNDWIAQKTRQNFDSVVLE